MNFSLPMPPLANLLREAALAEADGALQRMRKTRPAESDIHETRKACKKLRAWLVLLREPLGDHADRIEDLLREVARGLTATRESAVRRQTLQALADDHADGIEIIRLAQALFQLEAAPDAGIDARAVAGLAAARDAIADLKLGALDPGALERGLAASYRRVRKAMRRAAGGGAEAMHEWRKKLRRHTDQSRLLSPLWPSLWDKRAKALDKLNDALGDHHDLADLDAALSRIDLTAEQAGALRGIIADEQHRLAGKARQLGDRLFRQHALF
jgi:CHAD domain-containing protein